MLELLEAKSTTAVDLESLECTSAVVRLRNTFLFFLKKYIYKYIFEKCTFEKYTFEKYSCEKYTFQKYSFEKYTFEEMHS